MIVGYRITPLLYGEVHGYLEVITQVLSRLVLYMYRFLHCCKPNRWCNGQLFLYPHLQRGGYIAITLSVRPLVHPSVHTFVTDISASTGRNYCTSTSCLPCDLQMSEQGYSQHDVACNILLPLVRQIVSSSPGWVKPKTIKLIFAASPLSTQH